jgi:hypothetical protein
MWIGFMWLRIGTSGRLLLGSTEDGGRTSWLLEGIISSEGLRSMELSLVLKF